MHVRRALTSQKAVKMVSKAKFSPGKCCATPAALAKIDGGYAIAALTQHCQGQWGLVCEQDVQANDDALIHGERVISVYPLPDEAGEFWIITEADRSVTTILLPSEYHDEIQVRLSRDRPEYRRALF